MKKKILSLAALAIFTFTVSQFATANEPDTSCMEFSTPCDSEIDPSKGVTGMICAETDEQFIEIWDELYDLVCGN